MEILHTDVGYDEGAILDAINLGLSYVPRDIDQDGVNDYEDNCIETYNPDQADIDSDGMGDACDPCDNANIFVPGNINGDLWNYDSGSTDPSVSVDIFDVLRFVDIVQSFPTLLILIALISIFTPSIQLTIIVIGIVSWTGIARIVRGQVLSIKSKEYVQSAIAMGYSQYRILFYHIFIN